MTYQDDTPSATSEWIWRIGGIILIWKNTVFGNKPISVQLWNPSPNDLKSNLGFHCKRPVNKKFQWYNRKLNLQPSVFWRSAWTN